MSIGSFIPIIPGSHFMDNGFVLLPVNRKWEFCHAAFTTSEITHGSMQLGDQKEIVNLYLISMDSSSPGASASSAVIKPLVVKAEL